MAACYDIFTDPDHMKEFESGRCGAFSEADSFFLLMNNAYAYLTGTELAHYDPGHEEIPVFPEDHELFPDVADDMYEVEELTEEAYEEQIVLHSAGLFTEYLLCFSTYVLHLDLEVNA